MMTVTDQTTLSAQASQALAQPVPAMKSANLANPTAIKASAEKFVGMFMSQMFTEMFAGVGTNKVFGGGSGEDMFKSVLIDEYGKAAAKQGGMGLTDQIMRALIAQQERQS